MHTLDLDTIIDRRGTGCLKYDFAVQRGKRLDGADQHAFNELVAVAEHVGSRQSVAAGAGGERDPAVSGEPPVAGEP